MLQLFDKLRFYFQYPFVTYALIVGVLIALCSSLLGVILVLKRYSFIGDGLSHVAFGAMAIATILKITDKSLFILPVTIITAIIILKADSNTKVNGDAAIAMISVGALAVGYLLINVFSASANISGDVCTTLFGSTSILTLTQEEVNLCVVLSVFVICIYVACYNKIFAVTFDETFANTAGVSANFYNLLISIMIAIIIVLGMNLVGSLLISALIIFPVLSSMSILKSFRGVVISSAIISVCCSSIGIILSILFSTPVGATIVICNIVVYTLCNLKALILVIGFSLLLVGCSDTGTHMDVGTEISSKNNVNFISDNVADENNLNSDTDSETNSEENSLNFNTNSNEKSLNSDSKTEENVTSTSSSDNKIDYDLTEMGSDMVYATVYQMMIEPNEFIGKTFKINGIYSVTYYKPTHKYYHCILIKDAMECCSTGLEFEWDDGKHKYPDEYPQKDASITVTGTFETYSENGNTDLFCRLKNAKLKIN